MDLGLRVVSVRFGADVGSAMAVFTGQVSSGGSLLGMV